MTHGRVTAPQMEDKVQIVRVMTHGRVTAQQMGDKVQIVRVMTHGRVTAQQMGGQSPEGDSCVDSSLRSTFQNKPEVMSWERHNHTTHPVHLTNVGQRQAAADPQTKPTDLGCESACRLLWPTSTIAIY